MRKIVAAEIGNREFAENVIQHAGRVLDGVVADYQAGRFEPRERECVHEFFQRHAILQPDRDRDGEIVHQ